MESSGEKWYLGESGMTCQTSTSSILKLYIQVSRSALATARLCLVAISNTAAMKLQ